MVDVINMLTRNLMNAVGFSVAHEATCSGNWNCHGEHAQLSHQQVNLSWFIV